MSTPAYRFDLGSQHLIYAPLVDLAAVLNRDDYRKLLTSSFLSGELSRLRSLLLSDTDRPRPPCGELLPETLGVVTTRRCAMACTYCEFGPRDDDPGTLRTDLAFAAIDDYAARTAAAGRHDLPVHLFGGEPFDAWRLAQRIIAHSRAVAAEHGLRPFFEATTNGFYPPERARWIAENLHRVVLSIDGPPVIHNATRPDARGRPTSERIEANARIFSRGTVELNLRMCVTADTVEQLPESILYLLNTLGLLPTVIAVEPVRSLARDAKGPGPSPPPPAAFVEAFMSSLALCEERGVLLQFSGADLGAKVASFCPVGRDGCIVHTDGTIAGCYLPLHEWRRRGLVLDYGRVDPERGLVVAEDRLATVRSIGAHAYPECRDCFCRWHCAGGCHVYRVGRPRDRGWCTMVRAISLQLLLRQVGIDGSQVPLSIEEQSVALPEAFR